MRRPQRISRGASEKNSPSFTLVRPRPALRTVVGASNRFIALANMVLLEVAPALRRVFDQARRTRRLEQLRGTRIQPMDTPACRSRCSWDCCHGHSSSQLSAAGSPGHHARLMFPGSASKQPPLDGRPEPVAPRLTCSLFQHRSPARLAGKGRGSPPGPRHQSAHRAFYAVTDITALWGHIMSVSRHAPTAHSAPGFADHIGGSVYRSAPYERLDK